MGKTYRYLSRLFDLLFVLFMIVCYILALYFGFLAGEKYRDPACFFAIPIIAALVGILYVPAKLESFLIWIPFRGWGPDTKQSSSNSKE